MELVAFGGLFPALSLCVSAQFTRTRSSPTVRTLPLPQALSSLHLLDVFEVAAAPWPQPDVRTLPDPNPFVLRRQAAVPADG